MLAVGHPLPRVVGTVVEEGALPTQAARLQQEKGRVKLLLETHGEAAWKRTVDAAPSSTPLPRRASRAYYKLEELLRAHAVPPPRASLHLCEAPGGFVEATVDAFATPWFATTLDDGPAWAESVRRLAGGTLLPSGDLRDAGFQEAVLAGLVNAPPIDLVTADGAAPMDHDHLEAEAIDLARAQVNVALRALAPGGTLILKVFECCTAPTLRLVARLCATFAHCMFYKPTHSRPTNSELYLVCSEFEKEEREATPSVVDRHWWPTTVDIVDELAAQQAAALQAALRATRITKRSGYSHATVRAPTSTLR